MNPGVHFRSRPRPATSPAICGHGCLNRGRCARSWSPHLAVRGQTALDLWYEEDDAVRPEKVEI